MCHQCISKDLHLYLRWWLFNIQLDSVHALNRFNGKCRIVLVLINVSIVAKFFVLSDFSPNCHANVVTVTESRTGFLTWLICGGIFINSIIHNIHFSSVFKTNRFMLFRVKKILFQMMTSMGNNELKCIVFLVFGVGVVWYRSVAIVILFSF